jgi:hypothetical protein
MHLMNAQRATEKFAGKVIASFDFSDDDLRLKQPELMRINFTDGTSAVARLEVYGPEGMQLVRILG